MAANMHQEDEDRLLTTAEVAAWLGTTDRFPRRLVAERRIRFVKVGRHVRFPASAVRKFIADSTVSEAG
jgi:excisionase family DNA binding protein